MKAINGYLLLAICMATTLLAWQTSPMAGFTIPGLALTSLSLTFLLTTRLRVLEYLFHGLQNVYTAHKFMAMVSVLLLMVHAALMYGGPIGFGAQLGWVGLGLFLAIIIIALVGKFLQYEVWRMIHRVVFLAYMVGLYHVFVMMPSLFTSSGYVSLVVDVFALIGIASALYIMIFYQNFAFNYRGKVVSAKAVNDDTMEIEIEFNRDFHYDYGQFAFLKITSAGFEHAPHPFSISGGSGKRIFFTIKSSGDHTSKIFRDIKIGAAVKVDRSYGYMKLEEGRKHQVWIAGGIGVTPFLSYIREHSKTDQDIDFYYAYSGSENAVHLNMIRDFSINNAKVKVHLVDSNVDGFLDFDDYELKPNTTVFMCGPAPMMTSLAKEFKALDKKVDLNYEGFNFR